MQLTRLMAIGLVGALALSAGAPRAVAADTSTADQRSITVSGDGSVNVAPDVAFVTVGVQQKDPQASKAQDETNTITAAAIARIKALGIPAKDIQTVDISLSPQYDDAGTLTGFIASDSLSITVEHPKQAGAVIDAGVGAGANYNVSVGFGLMDNSAAQSAALRAAVSVAQRKAAAVAAQLGVSLQGAKVQVTENESQSPVPFAQAGAVVRAAVASTPVQTGTLTITDSVTVTYLL
jgi:uncharacterized protein YggE